MSANGYAIASHSGIDVTTVSPTAIGAMVNWLLTRRGIIVTRAHTGDDVRRTFDAQAMAGLDRLISVKISEVTAHG